MVSCGNRTVETSIQSQIISTYAYFSQGVGMEVAASQLTSRTSSFFVDICGTVFEQITSFAVPEVFSKGFNLSSPPSAVAAVLEPRVAGNTQGPRFLMQVWAVVPKSCVLPVPLLRSHIPRCLGTQHTVLAVAVSSALCVSHRA